jgi:hypothetical protein
MPYYGNNVQIRIGMHTPLPHPGNSRDKRLERLRELWLAYAAIWPPYAQRGPRVDTFLSPESCAWAECWEYADFCEYKARPGSCWTLKMPESLSDEPTRADFQRMLAVRGALRFFAARELYHASVARYSLRVMDEARHRHRDMVRDAMSINGEGLTARRAAWAREFPLYDAYFRDCRWLNCGETLPAAAAAPRVGEPRPAATPRAGEPRPAAAPRAGEPRPATAAAPRAGEPRPAAAPRAGEPRPATAAAPRAVDASRDAPPSYNIVYPVFVMGPPSYVKDAPSCDPVPPPYVAPAHC